MQQLTSAEAVLESEAMDNCIPLANLPLGAVLAHANQGLQDLPIVSPITDVDDAPVWSSFSLESNDLHDVPLDPSFSNSKDIDGLGLGASFNDGHLTMLSPASSQSLKSPIIRRILSDQTVRSEHSFDSTPLKIRF